MKLSALSVMVVFGDLATIEQGADGAADLVGPPRALFGESGILADDEARWRTAPLPQRCARAFLARAESLGDSQVARTVIELNRYRGGCLR
jgi:hypothetical protein